MAATARRWTPSEISLYETRQAQSVHPKLIALELGRTVGAVIMRGQAANVRKCRERLHDQFDVAAYIQEATQYVVPPAYVRRERDIRLSIPSSSVTQMLLADPVDGYSALATKARTISVQDALEICAQSTGKKGEITRLAAAYGVSVDTVRSILNGAFFDKLLNPKGWT